VVKIELINRLSESELPVIEATSFVSPKWVPQVVALYFISVCISFLGCISCRCSNIFGAVAEFYNTSDNVAL